MSVDFKKSLFIFRRDLRLEDNTGLLFALKNSIEVIPAFIFTPEQIEKNPYKSVRSLQFMIESLIELDEELKKRNSKLFLFYGKPEKIVEEVILKLKIDLVAVNNDYTPYSILRDEKIKKICEKFGTSFKSCEDALLNSPSAILKTTNKPYTLFTPYYKKALEAPVTAPKKNTYHNYYKGKISFAKTQWDDILPTRLSQAKGGRTAGFSLLKKLTSPTHLSAHLKFNTLSVREVYFALQQKQSQTIRSLYWRDFFSMISFHFPHVFTGPFYRKYEALPWVSDKRAFKKWCEGETGFPIVDAAMRQLKQTGWLPNRMRMIVASFLVKDLHINWQWGEKHFATHLIDYDPAINNGNWQWVASTGADHSPYFRIFNPWLQQKKFDPDCTYIKEWVPELRNLSPQAIHKAQKTIVDHKKEAIIAIRDYTQCG